MGEMGGWAKLKETDETVRYGKTVACDIWEKWVGGRKKTSGVPAARSVPAAVPAVGSVGARVRVHPRAPARIGGLLCGARSPRERVAALGERLESNKSEE